MLNWEGLGRRRLWSIGGIILHLSAVTDENYGKL
jgi:hypothetical protein